MKAFTFALLLATVLVTVQGKRIKYPEDYKATKQESRVVGGENAQEGEAPYQVSLQSKTFWHSCGGAIIDKDWILTAAHCVYGRQPEDINVATGTTEWKKPGALYRVRSVHMHCNYNRPISHNDIALLHLNSSIVFNEKTQPIALAVKPLREGDEVMLTGWGTLEAYGSTPDNLQKITLEYVSHKRCKELMKDDPDLDIGHMCTYTKVGEGACHGDSGGPLVSHGYLVGLVNWGYPCAIGYPDAHASPYFYLNWIRQIRSGNHRC